MANNNVLLRLLRYKFIIDEIEKGYRPSVMELTIKTNRFLENLTSYEEDVNSVSERTIKRDVKDIRTILGISIKSSNGYYVEENIKNSQQVHIALESLLMLYIQTNTPNANQFIRFASRKASAGSEHFFSILKSITDKKKVTFTYSQYEKKLDTQRLVSPLGLKEFKGFWYLVASDKKGIKTFGLDRINGLSISLEKAFIPEHFDLDEYYKHCYGIVRFEDSEPEEIIIKTTPIKAAYYKANPLHHSQQVVEETDQYTTFSLYIYLTYDLQQELRSHGEKEVQVLKPEDALVEERYR